jgi:hypothetical protein
MIISLELLIGMSIMLMLNVNTVRLGNTTMKQIATKQEMAGLAAAVQLYEVLEEELPGDLDDLDLSSGDSKDAWGTDYVYDDGDRTICSENDAWQGGERCVNF